MGGSKWEGKALRVGFGKFEGLRLPLKGGITY